MKKEYRDGATLVGINRSNEICVQLTMGKTQVSEFIPMKGVIDGINYMTMNNISDNEKLIISTDKDGLYIGIKSTGQTFWCREPRLTNGYPVHITITWGDVKSELQKFGLI